MTSPQPAKIRKMMRIQGNRRRAEMRGSTGRSAGPVPRALTTAAVLLTVGSAATDVACFTRLGIPAAVPAVPLVMLGGVIGTGLVWLRPRSHPAHEQDMP
jgi:hypothetical protein